MGPVKLFPNPNYTSKQPRDGVVPQVPCAGIFLGPSKSGKTVALISAILEQYRTADGSSVFERIYIFSPSIEIDDGWKPVKEFIENEMGVNTDREQVYFDKWDEGALRTIIDQQRKITRTSKQLGLKKLFQVLIVVDDFADQPELHRRTGDGALDTLFIRGRHMQISTWVSPQKLRLISAAVRVNMQFICIWRLRNQLELEAVLDKLSALLPKQELLAMYQEAARKPYSFCFIYYLKNKANMFYKRWEERFVVDGDAEPAEAQQPVNGRLPVGGASCWEEGRSSRASAATSGAAAAASPTCTTRAWPHCRPAGPAHAVQRMAVYKVRIADAFLSSDWGRNLYWIDQALGTLNSAQLPVGAYTGARLAAWISSNFSSATYVEAQNSIEVASDGGSYIDGALQIFVWVSMNPFNEVYLRSRELGTLGTDIICKVIIDKGVGHVMKDQTDDGPRSSTRPSER